MMKQFDKLQRASVKAELRLVRAKRARIRALNRLVWVRRDAAKIQRLYLRGEATARQQKLAVNILHQVRGQWARSVVRSEVASKRAFIAGFDLREAYRAREPLRAR